MFAGRWGILASLVRDLSRENSVFLGIDALDACSKLPVSFYERNGQLIRKHYQIMLQASALFSQQVGMHDVWYQSNYTIPITTTKS